MANTPRTTWRRIRSLIGASAADTADAALLARFVAERDEGAFAALVRRHGPMVYGVCRRVLSNPHDAEDAYQATFLILTDRAGSVRRGEALSCWLHGVALRVAGRLRDNLRRRKDRAPLPADVPQPERDDVSWREVRRLVDEELAKLPERFRGPLILCYLEGKTRDEAAAALGWSLSTFRGRLERGRERLRRRLERRGVALSAALLATLAARHAEAALPTVNASAGAGALAAEVMRTMFLGKVKAAALWCLAVLFLGAGVGAAAYHTVPASAGPGKAGAAEADPRPEAEAPAPLPEVKAPAPPPKPPTPPEEDGVVKDFKAHLDHFRLTVTLRPLNLDNFDTRYPVSDLRLHVWAGPIGEPGGKGTRFARITKEQAAKIIDVLARDNFFRDSVADVERLTPPEGDHVEVWASYRRDDKDPRSVQRWHALGWDAHTVRRLEAVRKCVDGEAAKLLGTMLASLADEHISKWRQVRSTPPPKAPAPAVEWLTFSPDGKRLLVRVSGRNAIQLLAADTLKELPITYPLNGACRPLGFTGDGQAWALSLAREEKDTEGRGDKTYELLHLGTGKMFWSFKTSQLVRQAVLGPDRKHLAVTDYADTTRVLLQGIAPGTEMTELGKHRSEIRCLAVSPDGKTLATGSAWAGKDSAEVILWDVEERSRIASQPLPANCTALQFTRDSSRLVALTKGKNREDGDAIVLWFNAKSGKPLGRLELKEQGDTTAVAASPNGKLLAVLWDRHVRIFDADSGKEIAATDSGDKVSGIAFSPDGTVLATGDENGVVTLWEAVR
jgi:RNA polymerase sigma factor (sigma-70 family)